MAMADALAFGAALRDARERAGNLSFDKLRLRVYDQIGAYAPTAETLRAMHAGKTDPDKVDLVLVCAIANVYGIDASTLAPQIADRLPAAQDLLSRSRCFWPETVPA